jgi:hypothetical protein
LDWTFFSGEVAVCDTVAAVVWYFGAIDPADLFS